MLPKNITQNHAVNMKGLSLLIMRAFDIKGGLFYTLTSSRHHAYKELVSLGVIQGRKDPLMYISGEILLFTVSRILFITGR